MHSVMNALTPGPVRRGLAVLAGLTPLGVVFAHALAYNMVHGDPHQRARVLDASGHGYFDAAVQMSLIAALAALLGITALAVRRRWDPATADVPRGVQLWGGLVVLQIAAFAGLELLERAGSGSLGGFLHEPAFLVALPLLVLGAGITATVVSMVVRAGRNLEARVTSGGPRRSVIKLEWPVTRPTPSGDLTSVAARAPPRRAY